MKIGWFFKFMFQIKNLKTQWIYCSLCHIMCTLKILTVLCFTKQKTKNRNKKWFCRSCLQCFSNEKVLIKHKEDCLSINRVQSVKVEQGTIEFENYFKQIPVPFKIYADFECNLESAEVYEGSYSKKYHDHVPCSFPYKVVCIDDRFSKPIVVFRCEKAAYDFVKPILKKYEYSKKIMKKRFNKNLIISGEKEYLFQQNLLK